MWSLWRINKSWYNFYVGGWGKCIFRPEESVRAARRLFFVLQGKIRVVEVVWGYESESWDVGRLITPGKPFVSCWISPTHTSRSRACWPASRSYTPVGRSAIRCLGRWCSGIVRCGYWNYTRITLCVLLISHSHLLLQLSSLTHTPVFISMATIISNIPSGVLIRVDGIIKVSTCCDIATTACHYLVLVCVAVLTMLWLE